MMFAFRTSRMIYMLSVTISAKAIQHARKHALSQRAPESSTLCSSRDGLTMLVDVNAQNGLSEQELRTQLLFVPRLAEP